jgi:hypothetical protein
MNPPMMFEHRDYDLACSVSVLDGGKYAPVVVATAKAWPRRARSLAIRPATFDTEDEALAAARAQATAWVDNYG